MFATVVVAALVFATTGASAQSIHMTTMSGGVVSTEGGVFAVGGRAVGFPSNVDALTDIVAIFADSPHIRNDIAWATDPRTACSSPAVARSCRFDPAPQQSVTAHNVRTRTNILPAGDKRQ